MKSKLKRKENNKMKKTKFISYDLNTLGVTVVYFLE